MGLFTYYTYLLELIGAGGIPPVLAQPVPAVPGDVKSVLSVDIPADPTDPFYGLFGDARFLGVLGLSSNPLAPVKPGTRHPKAWCNRDISDAWKAVREFFGSDLEVPFATKTQRAQKFRQRALGSAATLPRGIDLLSVLANHLDKQFLAAVHRAQLAQGPDTKDGLGIDRVMRKNTSVCVSYVLTASTDPSKFPRASELDKYFVMEDLHAVLFEKTPQPGVLAVLDDYCKNDLKARLLEHWQKFWKAYDKIRDATLNTLSLRQARAFIRKFAVLRRHIGPRKWACDNIGDFVAFCDDTAALLGCHTDPTLNKKLPDVFVKMLLALKPSEKESLELAIREAFEYDGDDDPFDVVEVGEIAGDCSARWLKLSPEELDIEMGTTEGFVPYMATHAHPRMDINAYADGEERRIWEEELAKMMADQPSELRGFKLRHHQLAGVMAKAVMYFDGESGLNLDDVGVGKTIQTLAFLSYIAWMHDYKLQHGVFPGRYWRNRHFKGLTPGCTGDEHCKVQHHDCSVFGAHAHCTRDPSTCPVRGEHGNIPFRPSLVSVPPTIATQWVNQARAILENGKMSIVPCVSANANVRKIIAQQHIFNPKSMFRQYGLVGMIIVVTSTTLEAEFSAAMDMNAAAARQYPEWEKYKVVPESLHSLYSLRYGVVYHDEVHNGRTLRSLRFHAMRAISMLAVTAIGLSATPVVTSAADIIAIALIICVAAFATQEQYEEN
ncbi:hypothetical protein AURDEDRAFT_178247, partial [Auricularia subglabra TFB-10046 SS5]